MRSNVLYAARAFFFGGLMSGITEPYTENGDRKRSVTFAVRTLLPTY